MAGSVTNPIIQTTGSCVSWMVPRSRAMPQTVTLGLMGRKFVSVWLSNTPLTANRLRVIESSPILYVILPPYINYEWKLEVASHTIATHALHAMVQRAPFRLSGDFVEQGWILKLGLKVDDIVISCRTPYKRLGPIRGQPLCDKLCDK
jgi:hypothetical protein